jgi:hypothetical protein
MRELQLFYTTCHLIFKLSINNISLLPVKKEENSMISKVNKRIDTL